MLAYFRVVFAYLSGVWLENGKKSSEYDGERTHEQVDECQHQNGHIARTLLPLAQVDEDHQKVAHNS